MRTTNRSLLLDQVTTGQKIQILKNSKNILEKLCIDRQNVKRVNNKNKCLNILESFQKNDDDGAVAQDLVDNQYGEVNEHENDGDDDGDNVGDDGDDDVDDGIAVVALDLVYSQYGGGGRLILTFTTTIANTKI